MFTVRMQRAMLALFVLSVVVFSAHEAQAQPQFARIPASSRGPMQALINKEKSPWLLYAMLDVHGKPLNPVLVRQYPHAYYQLPLRTSPDKVKSLEFLAQEIKAYAKIPSVVVAQSGAAIVPQMSLLLEDYTDVQPLMLQVGTTTKLTYRLKNGFPNSVVSTVDWSSPSTVKVVELSHPLLYPTQNLADAPNQVHIKALAAGKARVTLATIDGLYVQRFTVMGVAPPVPPSFLTQDWPLIIAIISVAMLIAACAALWRYWRQRRRLKRDSAAGYTELISATAESPDNAPQSKSASASSSSNDTTHSY
jgi:hypothetical protein